MGSSKQSCNGSRRDAARLEELPSICAQCALAMWICGSALLLCGLRASWHAGFGARLPCRFRFVQWSNARCATRFSTSFLTPRRAARERERTRKRVTVTCASSAIAVVLQSHVSSGWTLRLSFHACVHLGVVRPLHTSRTRGDTSNQAVCNATTRRCRLTAASMPPQYGLDVILNATSVLCGCPP